MSRGAKGAKKNMELASASSTEHRINLILRLSSILLFSKNLKLRSIDLSSSSLRIAIIYRRPPSKKHKIASGEFSDQFSEFLEKYADGTNSCMIIGDFNYHWKKPDDTNVNRLRLLLASLNFAQHVTEPTHTSGHTLDLVITPRQSTFLHSVCTSLFISDHAAIHCD